MWLLDTTSLALSPFFNNYTPYYAILSHTWGAEEVSFQDIRGPHEAISNKAGFRKIKDCCASALGAGFKYVWIDTCCIDKTNSTELSEAINSMFRWYENAVTCYAYLEDVEPDGRRFDASRWFQRGWTLQELIAPGDILFFDSYWNEIGSRASLAEQIEKITGVPVGLLLMDTSLRDHCVAEIMCWAARRETTRLEDRAYSLLGLFGVSMPLIYGEGENAFFRLQLEIMKTTTDHSLFAWYSVDMVGKRQGALATTPDHFKQSGNYRRLAGEDESSFEMTNLGLRISLPCVSITNGSSSRFACLQCKHDSQDGLLGIWLMEATNAEGGPLGRFYRSHLELLTRDSPQWAMFSATKPRPTLLHIIQPDNRFSRRISMQTFFGGPRCLVDYNDLIQDGYCLENFSGPRDLKSFLLAQKLEGSVVFGPIYIYQEPVVWFLSFKHRHRLTQFRVEIHTINGKIISKIELEGNGATMSDPVLQELQLPAKLPHGEGIIDYTNPQRVLGPGEAVKLTAKRAIIADEAGFAVKLEIMNPSRARDCYGLSDIIHQH